MKRSLGARAGAFGSASASTDVPRQHDATSAAPTTPRVKLRRVGRFAFISMDPRGRRPVDCLASRIIPAALLQPTYPWAADLRAFLPSPTGLSVGYGNWQ